MPEQILSIGLDIDDKSVKFVKTKQTNGNVTLLKYAVRDIPASEDKVKAVSDILKDLFKGERNDTDVYACAFGGNISLKRLTIPLMPDEEIPEALKWEAKNIVPFPFENAQVSFYKVGKISEGSTEKYDILLAVASEELVKFFSAISKESGIKFAGISIVPFAISSLLERGKKTEAGTVSAVIDIGSEAASINLFKGKNLNFTREITVAGDSITKAMTGLLVADHWQLNLTYEQAEEIKKKYGIPPRDSTEKTESGIPLVHIYEMIAPTLRRLQNEIIRSFDYYKEEFREEKIDQIFLTGGTSSLLNLQDFLTNSLGIKVETIDPLENIKIDRSSGIDEAKLKSDMSRMSLALGLALDRAGKINLQRGKEKVKRSKINIEDMLKQFNIKLPANFKIDLKIPANASVWAVILTLLIATSYDVYLINEKNKFTRELATKQQLLEDIKTLAEKRQMFDQISNEETHIREILSQITRVLPSGVMLTDLDYDNTQHRVLIVGEASDTKTVGRLIKSLEDSPNFKRTLLIEARKTVMQGSQRILFKVSFNIT